jgi:UDP-N-acetylglucosamine 2-epimerase (non-hydrolysing)
MSRTEVQLIGGTGTEAVKLAPVAVAMRAAGLLVPQLTVVGEQFRVITRALATFDLAPGVTIDAEPLTDLILRLDMIWTERRPAAVIVLGDSPSSLAAALAAAWRNIPVVHLYAGLRHDEFETPAPDEANSRLIAQVANLHLVPVSLAAMNLIDEGVAARSVLITGDTGYDAALAIAGRRQPSSRVATASPYGDGLAAQRAAQAVAALLGLADRPEPMPIPSFTGTPSAMPFGA